MKTIIVTGGAGFIGSNLCRKLLNNGDQVICIDDLSSGKLENIEELKQDNNFSFYNCDISSAIGLDNIFYINKFNNIDEIYNLACPASPPFYQSNPIHTMDTNYIGMKNMLNIAYRYKAKILQTSTSEVYGDPEVHPQPESYRGNVNPDGIRACYDEGKRISETLCFEYNRLYDVDVKVVRIFNTYGPFMRADDGRVISNFICQAINNKDITIYGNGSQTRSFCYVDDMVDGLIKMMGSNIHGPVNLGNPGEFTVRELSDIVIRLTNSKSKLIYLDLPKDDPTKRKPIIDLAKKELNWEPKVNLEEGLKKTIEYFSLLK